MLILFNSAGLLSAHLPCRLHIWYGCQSCHSEDVCSVVPLSHAFSHFLANCVIKLIYNTEKSWSCQNSTHEIE